MIFYFTGTGNSRWVAEALGTAFDEPLVSIADALNEGKDENVYPLREREKVFFQFFSLYLLTIHVEAGH